MLSIDRAPRFHLNSLGFIYAGKAELSAGPPTLSCQRPQEWQREELGVRVEAAPSTAHPPSAGGRQRGDGTHPAFSRTDGTSSPENQPRREGASASAKTRGAQGERRWPVAAGLPFPGGGEVEKHQPALVQTVTPLGAEHGPRHRCLQQDRARTAAPRAHPKHAEPR